MSHCNSFIPKRIVLISSIALFSISINASNLKNPENIYNLKCAMCHDKQSPMVAPSITLAMKSVTIGLDAVEGPMENKALKKFTIKFLKDYFNKPEIDESFCEDIMFKRFNLMPSMNGFLKPNEMNILLPWVYDNFAPEQYKVDK